MISKLCLWNNAENPTLKRFGYLNNMREERLPKGEKLRKTKATCSAWQVRHKNVIQYTMKNQKIRRKENFYSFYLLWTLLLQNSSFSSIKQNGKYVAATYIYIYIYIIWRHFYPRFYLWSEKLIALAWFLDICRTCAF